MSGSLDDLIVEGKMSVKNNPKLWYILLAVAVVLVAIEAARGHLGLS